MSTLGLYFIISLALFIAYHFDQEKKEAVTSEYNRRFLFPHR